MKRMKRIILVCLLHAFYIGSYAQQGFVFELKDESEKSLNAAGVVETSTGDYLLLNQVMPYPHGHHMRTETRIIKISSDGVFLDEISLNFHDTVVLLDRLIPHPDLEDSYIALGAVGTELALTDRLVVIQLNANLEINSFHTIAISGITRIGAFLEFIVHSENDIVVASNFEDADAMMQYTFYARITVQGELKQLVLDTNTTGPLGDFFVIDSGVDKKYGILRPGTSPGGGSMLSVYELDAAFNCTFLTYIPHVYKEENGSHYALVFGVYQQTVRQYPNEKLLISVQARESWGSTLQHHDRSPMLFRTGKDFVYDEAESIIFASKNDTVEYPSYFSSFDFIDPNQIFYSFQSDVYPQFIACQPYPTYVVINKLNANLELQWQHYYGGDAYYFPLYTFATSDGGCMVAGSKYDFNPSCKHDLFAIKLNSEGFIGLDEESELLQAMAVYPNPFHDRIQLLLPPNTREVSVYNSSGMSVKKANGKCNELILDNVPSGLYVVVAQTMEGKVYTQKIVKD